MTSLTTHVLDQASGLPGRNIAVDILKLEAGRRIALGTVSTNSDGRTDAPLLTKAEPGTYELVFHIGAYFQAQGLSLTEPAFLDEVVIRFGLSDSHAHYHVPLLVSPYGYSAYRGS
ncbi:MAG TPA: hydroxyisourate hydrolase [Gammaproteobacteria bacterium]|jgi:5-hydroxyisourate hydrolase|nr:hydroxyisourate hydrolase [Gammaproteobacteria bacterium]